MSTVRDVLVKAAIGVALAVAAVSMYLAFDTGRDEEPVVRRGAILRVFPEAGTVALRQEAIGVELAFGYRASLRIDRRVIPDDQLDVVAGINRVSFTPGPDKEIEQLDEGRHCVVVEYAMTTSATTADNTPGARSTTTASPQPPAASAVEPVTATTGRPESYSWCFTAA